MIDVLDHRGPDDEGVHIDGSIGLGFKRLAILDLSQSGHQPMVDKISGSVIVFNGEIYNFIEIREELRALGHQFRSTSDTEVLLKAYSQWGEACLNKFNGMWSFVLYDKARRTLFVSRDRFGVKPLYQYSNDRYIVFSSEIKSILASGFYRSEVDWNTSAKFLIRDHLDNTPATFYKGIESVPPGTKLTLTEHSEIISQSYWNLPEGTRHHDDPLAEYKHLFSDAIRLRLRSDVPVGVFLSGGLDSTSIISEIDRINKSSNASSDRVISAFTYHSNQFDESRYIDDTLACVNAELIRISPEPEVFWENIGSAHRYHDEPFHSMTALIGFELYRLASKNGIKVVLNGQGADETAAGYHVYFRKYWDELISGMLLLPAHSQIKEFVAAFGGNVNKEFLDTIKRMLTNKAAKFPWYRQTKLNKKLSDDVNSAWCTRDFSELLAREERDSESMSLFEYLKFSVNNRPLPKYLRVEDRNSMAHSVETRLPFLDYRIVELLFQLESKEKLNGSFNKYIMRRAMADLVPKSVVERRDKMGFPSEVSRWVADGLYSKMYEVFDDRVTRERGIFDVDKILTALVMHRKRKVDVGEKLFKYAQYELWLRNSL
tara:strand:- start:14335 stop:16140 length:1806 start_codon:yes stop_codon:yes gene_type:complete